ncbi:MAG: hypothetical protein WDZ49_11360 [Litorilinea sp.]
MARRLWAGVVGCLVAALSMVGCRPITGEAPSPTALPSDPAVEIRYVEGGEAGAWQSLEAVPAAVSTQWDALIGSIDAQARTFFDPARFDAEVAELPQVQVRYAEATDFVGQGFEWRAQELIAVVVNDEPMLLARSEDSPDWSVYLPAEPDRLVTFIGAVEALE